MHHRRCRFPAHHGPLASRIGERPMSGKTASCRAPARQSRAKYGRRRKPEQMDLFGNGQSSVVIGSPAWPELPAETPRALIRLIAPLLLEHADKSQAAAMTGADHDLWEEPPPSSGAQGAAPCPPIVRQSRAGQS